jgi:starch phosphorylase
MASWFRTNNSGTDLDPIAVLAHRLPPELEPLAQLAYDYWWSWQPGGDELFAAIDPDAWDACEGNPVRLLLDSPPQARARAAANRAIVEGARRLVAARDADRARPFRVAAPATAERPIAYISAEFAIHRSLPIYSGGLGVLAGDLLKEASDRAVPLVGVGLFYRRGYFHQRLDPSGWQHEHTLTERRHRLPMMRVLDDRGVPLDVHVPIHGKDVVVQVWRVQVGRVPLFLLDSDVPANGPVERWITAQLYVGDREVRLMQYALLGIGAVRALAAMGIDPALVHLNEGHAALAAVELARPALGRGARFADAIAEARARVVFTTHTPLAAGNEVYGAAELSRALGPIGAALGVRDEDLFALGASGSDQPSFGMTQCALRASRSANAVSRRHGEIARAMWQPLFGTKTVDEVPITHVTNGVHVGTWMAAPMRALLARHLGLEWRWAGLDEISDDELWTVRNQLRAALVERVRTRSVIDRLARGESVAYAEEAARTFDPHTLTVGFARRIASYKRLHLLVHDAARTLALLRGAKPLQVVIAGKAHPRDTDAKRLVQRIFALKGEPLAAARVVFLEDHDMGMAAELVAGCDVWINLPRPPLEASGTSGMKAMLNGGLHLSVLDGWWAEAFDGKNGWGIHSESGPDEAAQDARDADALYGLIEREVVPLYYDRDERGLPRGWIQRIRASMRSLAPRFNSGRMLEDYLARVYAPPSAAR